METSSMAQEVGMIPMARDAVPMYIWRSVSEDDDGDVIEKWDRTEDSVLVSAYPLGSSKTQTEDGQVIQEQYRLLFALGGSQTISTGDRLGDMVGPVWHLLEAKVSGGRASCIGVRL